MTQEEAKYILEHTVLSWSVSGSDAREAIQMAIKELERKKGKWIEEIGMLMCSECGDAWGTEQEEEVRSFNFCPNCGADMRKGEEE